ncbi:M81 family metallopeptidase [Halobacteria archaeon AArc-m2/3/4]|uniref:M81 family metallopeptidase n=1 Tax=Natronoglomus mannanivorans TaxID=2979990 RepID=A0AAP3E4R2_9EURY|nr:M81 family metallopeptidase [Halobacteria archaeon AArc-xg1-1]MCU4975998.1 M81 family metallopeptidase [Halobacteria archaeon AArc-m2/3/4]
MRVAVGAISHETNTFTERHTSIEDVELVNSDELLTSFNGGRSLEGITAALERADEDVSLHPTVGMASIPSGTVEFDVFDRVLTELLDSLEGESLDGVCLDLHGSMYVEGLPDPEGEILTAVRDVVGPDVPITVALDMHATITETMVEHADGVAGYRTAPHTDVVETGTRAAELLLSQLRGEADLELGWVRLPMLLAGERSETEAEPMRTLIELLERADEIEGVYDANYFLGFPWADSPHAGCHALVTGDANASETIDETVRSLATEFWNRRRAFDFTTEAYRLEEALDEAATTEDRPVVVADTGDIPGAGASQDVTNLLEAILEREDLGSPVVAVFTDSKSQRDCVAAGEGATVTLSLGRSVPNGDPLVVSGTVEAVFETGDVGLAHVTLDGAEILVSSERTNVHRDPSLFERLDIEVDERDVIVLKSGYLSPAWKEVAARRLFALTPGDTNQLLSTLPYERIPRPIDPLDETMEWSV